MVGVFEEFHYRCEHKNTVRAGTTLCRDGVYQRKKCKDCGSIIKGDKLI